MSYGANYKAGLAFQSNPGSYGTASQVGSFHLIPLVSDDISLDKATIKSKNLTGQFALSAIYDGINKVAGTVDVEATPTALGCLLQAVINDPTQVNSGSIRTFTFLPRTVDWNTGWPNHNVTYIKEFADATSAELFYDCQFSDIEFSISAGQLLKVKASMVGGSRLTGGGQISSYALTPLTGEFNDAWMWDVASVSYGGAGQSNFSDITIKVDEMIDPLYALTGNLQPLKYTRKDFREVTIDGTFYMSDRSMLNNFVTATQQRLIVSLINSRNMVQSGYFASLTLDVPQVKITSFKLAVSGPGEVAIKFQGMGVIDPNSNYIFGATLVSSYANTSF